MLEIAKGVAGSPIASELFEIHFISDGGDFESLIEKHGFALTRMEPRLTAEKIEHIAKVDRGEKFSSAFTNAEMIRRVENEISVLKRLTPVAVVTGSYPSIPVTCRVLKIPLVWVVQSTWLPAFFEHGAGMTDHVRPGAIKAVADACILVFINFWIRHGFLNSVNHAAIYFGVRGYESIFSYWRGDIPWSRSHPNSPGSNCLPIISSRVLSSPKTSLYCLRKSRYSDGQAHHLLRHGKLRQPRDRRKNHRELRG